MTEKLLFAALRSSGAVFLLERELRPNRRIKEKAYQVHQDRDQVCATHDGEIDDAILQNEFQELPSEAHTLMTPTYSFADNMYLDRPSNCEH